MPALQDALGRLPSVQSHQSQPGRPSDAADLVCSLTASDRPLRLLVAYHKTIQPRDAQAYAFQVKRHPDRASDVRLLAAQHISPGARRLLQQEGLSWWDESGSLYLVLLGNVYYVDKPASGPVERRMRSVFAGRRAQVLHAMLLDPKRRWHGVDLARAAGVSPYTVQQVFTWLEAQTWVERQGSGPAAVRHLVEPAALLDDWARHHSLKNYTWHRFYRLAQTPAQLETSVRTWLSRQPYALTLEAGAHHVAPFVTTFSRLTALVPPGDYDALARSGGFRPVDEGENVLLLSTPSSAPLLGRHDIDGLSIASDIQLYLDLMAYPRRGKEQAQHLRQTRIGF
jgi:hypothetical protein